MHTRTLLVASLSLLATSAIAQTQYARWAPIIRTVKGCTALPSIRKTGALNDKTLVSKLPNAAQLTVSHDGKSCIWQAKWSRAWCRRCASVITAR